MRGLALSGGGFRATLFHLGVISYLYDVERAWRQWDNANSLPANAIGPRPFRPLSDTCHIASVSGGSILAAHLVLNWKRYTDFKNPGEFAKAANEIISFTQKDIRGRIVRQLPITLWPYAASVLWRRSRRKDWEMPAWLNRSTTDSLARSYDKYLFHGARLRDLDPANNVPSLSLLAVNLGSDGNNSVAFTYEGLVSYSSSLGSNIAQTIHADDTELVGRAVAASSAFPGLFTPLFYNPSGSEDILRLSDGGVYDNLGVRKFLNDIAIHKPQFEQIIVSDASSASGSKFGLEFFEPITVPIKAADILFRRVYDFEVAAAYPSLFCMVGLRRNFSVKTFPIPPLRGQYRIPLSRVRTDLDEFSDLEVFALVRQGYSAAHDSLAFPLPNSSSGAISQTWSPTPRLAERFVNELTQVPLPKSDQDTIDEIEQTLEASRDRKWRLWRPSDPVSLITAVIVIFFVVGSHYLYGIYFAAPRLQKKVDETQAELTKSEENSNKLESQLKVANDSLEKANFHRKFVLPLQTDLTLEDAHSTVQDVTKKGFNDVSIFLVNYEGGPKYRTVAIYDSPEIAEAEKNRAMTELRPSANKYHAFPNFCNQKLIWDQTMRFYICEERGGAAYGYRMILEKNISEAIAGFTLAEGFNPGGNDYFEMIKLLASYRSKLKDSSTDESNKVWGEIARRILQERYGYLNSTTRSGLQILAMN